jgi:hypothetical protein
MLQFQGRGLCCALALLALSPLFATAPLRAQELAPLPDPAAETAPSAPASDLDPAGSAPASNVDPASAVAENVPVPGDEPSTDHVVRLDESNNGEPLCEGAGDGWFSQWVPAGIIYHSYMAGPQEPRSGIFILSDLNGDTFGDAALGGRMGFWKYGNADPSHPEGWQLDFFGAALPRLNLKHQEDLESCDYVFGLPLTYGNEVWQTKFGYAHLSSHMGDEFAIRNPGALNERVNYTRDSLVWGNSYYVVPWCRMYEELGWAAHCDGFAHRWTTQFGTELSRPGLTPHATPFFAINGRVREDDDWVGDVNIQTGWLRRGILGQTLRYGLDYYNGRSSQSQFQAVHERQVGFGVWYDF